MQAFFPYTLYKGGIPKDKTCFFPMEKESIPSCLSELLFLLIFFEKKSIFSYLFP